MILIFASELFIYIQFSIQLQFQCFMKIISSNVWVRYFCGISKDTFEIPHKIFFPYIERYGFYSQVEI